MQKWNIKFKAWKLYKGRPSYFNVVVVFAVTRNLQIRSMKCKSLYREQWNEIFDNITRSNKNCTLYTSVKNDNLITSVLCTYYSLNPVARGRHKLGSSSPCGPAMASSSSQETWSPTATMTTAASRNPYNSHIKVNTNVSVMVCKG